MSRYKIEILNNSNTYLFKQLENLIKKFAIDIFMVQKFELANESYNKKIEYINNYESYLSTNELNILKKDISERVKICN